MRSYPAGGVPRWDQVTAGSGETARSEGHAWRIAREKSAFSASTYSCSQQGSSWPAGRKRSSAFQPLARLRKKSSPGFDPAVFGLRRARWCSDQHNPRRLPTHDVAHEGAFLKDEVIRWKNRHNRFRVLRMNLMCAKQDSGQPFRDLAAEQEGAERMSPGILEPNTRRACGTQKLWSATEGSSNPRGPACGPAAI
jgi:hypothetical protein